MLSKSLIQKIKKKYAKSLDTREALIVDSRPLLRDSKKAIFALHRGDMTHGEALIHSIFKDLHVVLRKVGKDHSSLYDQGAFLAAVEEYLEAVFYFEYLSHSTTGYAEKLMDIIPAATYIGALADYTGELARFALNKAAEKQYDVLPDVQKEINVVLGQMLDIDITGKNRMKLEDIKRNLKKVEGIAYDISLRT